MDKNTAIRASDILTKTEQYEDVIDVLENIFIDSDIYYDESFADSTLKGIIQEAVNKIRLEINKLNEELKEL